MTYILQMDFDMDGPFGEEMAEGFAGLAESINEEKGFLWKVWTENPDTKEAGGIYAFETKEATEEYLEKHSARLKEFGITGIRSKLFRMNEALTKINNGTVK
ncbi:monooxygenase [Salimicrobium humidisoli]|uniref:Monooxygenase n=1 Tax=Salimicrobium humidisoli TaxID=2029857 RepID=A0ABX4HTD4_9BACI|nr:monooxygenase [Salimicrobium humidisoli]PBB06486.1 monooxygenase [Salimicrobium humidisoli]